MHLRTRSRILRSTPAIRSLVAETHLRADDFIAPLFIDEGKQVRHEIASMPGYFRNSLDITVKEVRELHAMGLKSVLLFIKCRDELKDNTGKEAWNKDGLMQRSKLQISLTFVPDVLQGVPKDIEMTIFRIIQEALGNVYRHAASDSARVEVVGQAEQIIVKVRDYGKGISPKIARMESSGQLGVGITGMRERVRQLGGELSITRAEPGTLVEATIPLMGPDVTVR